MRPKANRVFACAALSAAASLQASWQDMSDVEGHAVSGAVVIGALHHAVNIRRWSAARLSKRRAIPWERAEALHFEGMARCAGDRGVKPNDVAVHGPVPSSWARMACSRDREIRSFAWNDSACPLVSTLMDLRELAQDYRRRAEHLQKIARRFYTAEARDGLLEAAGTWDELAIAAERDIAWQRQSARS